VADIGNQQKEATTMTLNATPTPGKLLVSPKDHTLIMIDFQSQMSFATKSIDAVQLRNNAALVASAAAGFKVPTILTTVAEKSFSGPMFAEITDAFPGQKLLDRTSMNTWEDGPPSVSLVRPFRRSIRASKSMRLPMPVATCPTRRMSARWTAWCRPEFGR